ncbi:hypothetical protein EVAR_49708_1 [Eumeta japonica]|uniref:Uncharacterized protein n=1 Tax=Eumeta variegata TaxID=151549 RepID=A0A4C1Z227_EUMVA|nr:hypothetical protein EVAR_49708_1 [Eumeta japonica]
MVTSELERIKVSKLQDQNIKDEYVERLKNSLGEIKRYECLEHEELWKVTKTVLVDEAKKINHSEQGKDILKDKLEYTKSTGKDAKESYRMCEKKKE